MTYRLRNTLVLALLLLIVGGVAGWFLFVQFPAEKVALRAEHADIAGQLAGLEQRKEYRVHLDSTIAAKRKTLSTLDKTIERKVTLAGVLDYLDDIQDRFGSVKFTLVPEQQQTGGEFGFLRFKVSGEANYPRLFRLVWALERGPKVFVVETLSLRGVEGVDPETKHPQLVAPFEMTVRAPYADVPDLPPLERTLADVHAPYTTSHVIAPLIRKVLPTNEEGLLESERAELRAILPGVALVSDHTGTLHELRVGDRVYMGYLTAINNETNTVEFTLNKGGLVETHVLRLGSSPEEM